MTEEIREYVLQKIGVEEGFPFGIDTLVFKVGGKMFLLIPLDLQPTQFSAKADPDWSAELREEFHQISGAYHMNKTHWNTVVCVGLKKDFVFKLIDHSYDLVVASLPKKEREKLQNGF